MIRYWEWPFAILLASLCVALIFDFVPGNSFDFAVTLLFLSICPGIALVRWARIKSLMMQLMTGIALSFALDALVMGLLMYNGLWNPQLAIVILIVFCDLNAIVQFFVIRPPRATYDAQAVHSGAELLILPPATPLMLPDPASAVEGDDRVGAEIDLVPADSGADRPG